MSSPKRIQRKNPREPTPTPDILQTRGFSNGKKARESKLLTTKDILQTRPFAPRDKDVSRPKDTRSFSEKMEGAEFRYKGASIQAFAPSTPSENSILSPFSLPQTDGLGEEETRKRSVNLPMHGI